VLDTREGSGSRVGAGGIVRLDADALGIGALPTGAATGVMLNLTVADPLGPGFLTAYPCASSRPQTSNLNFAAGDVVANFVVVQPDDQGAVCIYAHSATHVVVDVMGTVSAGFTGGVAQRLLDTRVANLPANWP
jgi:hypothetical protein